jgi:hypothetical protein
MSTDTKTEIVLASNQWRRLISGTPYGESKLVELTVTAELVKRGGNSYPYYSITGSVKKLDKRYRDPYITGGCIHDIILEHYPELVPLVAVHLSAADGQPMHAEANARYWAGLSTYRDGSPMGEYKRSMLAQHLQADKDTADKVREGLTIGLPWDRITAELGLIELWSKQAGAARKLLKDREVSA